MIKKGKNSKAWAIKLLIQNSRLRLLLEAHMARKKIKKLVP